MNTQKAFVCGSRENTPGLNLFNAINDTKAQIGIPESRIPEALAIMKRALDSDEFEIMRMSFGLGMPRLFQNEIAKKLYMSPSVVSRTIARGIKKLQARKYKKQLNDLVPSIDDVRDAVEVQRKLEAERQVSAALRKQLADVELKLSKFKLDYSRLMAENASLKAECEMKTNQILNIHSISGSAMNSQKKNIDRFNGLFDDKTRKKLEQLGITDIDGLIRMSRNNLVGLRVSVGFIDYLEQTLKASGMKLRES